MIKKILLALLFLFVAVTAALVIWRVVNYVRDKDPDKTFFFPRVVLSMLEITSLTTEKTEMTARMLIKNQMPFSFTADSLQYRLFINNTQVMKSRYKKSITLRSNDSTWISLPIVILNHDLDSVLKDNERRNIDSVEYHLQASFFTDLVFKRELNLDVKRFLPLIHIPKLVTEHIQVDSLNFSRAALQVFVSITNQNVFPLKANNLAYEFSVEDNEWIKGIIPGLTDIEATSVYELSIPVRMSFKEVSKTLFDLMKKGRNVNYKLRLTFRMESENKTMKNSKVVLESSGSVKSLLKVVKK